MESNTPNSPNSSFRLSAETEAFINTLPGIVRKLTAEANCLWSSHMWQDFTGQTLEESLLSGWLDAVHPDNRKKVIETITKAYKKQQPYNIEYRIRQYDGSYHYHLDNAIANYDESGAFIGFTSILSHLQNRKDQQNEGDYNLRNLVESAPFPIGVYTGLEMKIVLANKAIKEIFGKGDHVIGKLYPEILPELEGTGIFEQLKEVYETGIPFESENKFLNITENGIDRPFYFSYIFTPLFDEEGKVYGVMNTAADVTELNIAKIKTEQSEKRFRSLIEEAPVATCLFISRELKIDIANEEMIKIWGKGDSVLGKPFAEALPELEGQPFLEILDRIFDTGETFQAREARADIIMEGKLRTFYFDYTYKPLFDSKGNVYGIMDMAIDVTDRVIANLRIEENQHQLLASFEQSPVGIAILDKDLVFTLVNPFYGDLVGRKPGELVNKTLYDALPELKGREFDQLLYSVIETGIAYVANEVEVDFLRNGRMETIFVNFTYQPQFKIDGSVSGIFVVVIDVTQQVVSRKKVEASEAKLRSVIMNAPAGIGLFVGRDLIVQLPNKTFIDIVGKGPDIEGKPLREVMPELITEGQPFLKILDDVYTTGIMFQSYGAQVKIVQDGVMTYNYYNITYSPLFDENNEIYAIMDIAIDVTDTVLARQKAEEAEASLRGAVELAELATWSLDIKNNIFSYSERFMEWLGFSEDTKNMEEAYNPLPDEFREQVTQRIQEAIKPGGTGTYVNEHPVINRSTGQKRIIHAQAQVFYDAAGNPEILSGSAQDVTQERELQQQLEYEVKKRTEELQEANAGLAEAIDNLQKTNAELAQFAYIASHDLQEPIRKISIFSKMLEDSLGNIDVQSRNYLSKISTSTSRMMNLIRDVLAYSQLSKEHQAFEAVDLNVIVQSVIADFDLIVEQKKATIAFNELPVIEAIPLQMSQLFANLISNSLKYSRSDFNPIINITASALSEEEAVAHGIYEAGAYYKLEFRDNGIGFQQEHASQIFNIFQRLHGKTEYDGTGIGLAICKKIAQNHHGDIYAVADSQKGALFVVLLPLKQI